VEDRFANRVLKALVYADYAKDTDDKAVEPLNAGPLLLDVMRLHVPQYATNWGSFVIVALAEEPETRSEVLEILRPHMKALEEAAADREQKGNEKGNEGSKLLVEMLQGKK